jgi:hypothetical protein
MTTRGAGSGEPMERLSATERLKALLPNLQPRSGNQLGDLPDIGRSEEPPSVKRHAMNLLSPSLAITNAIQTRGPAAPTRADHDGELLAALRRRDRTAAECLVARYGDRAYGLAMGITRNAQDAEETVQDALWSVSRRSIPSEVIRPSDPGSTGSSPTPPIRSYVAARADVTRSPWTRSSLCSTRMGGTPVRSATGPRASKTRPCRPNFGPR